MFSHLSKWISRSTLPFSHLFGLCKAPSQQLKFPQDNIMIYTLSSHFLHLWGNTAHSLCYRCSGQWIHSRSIHANACIIILSSIKLDLSFCWLFFTLFSHTLILIGYNRNNQFMSMLIHNDHFLQFLSQTRTFSFIYISYLWQCSHIPDVLSPFILTPFAVTRQPSSTNHQETELSSTSPSWPQSVPSHPVVMGRRGFGWASLGVRSSHIPPLLLV